MERIFKWFTAEGCPEKAALYARWFTRNFKPSNFYDIDRLFVCFLAYCSKLNITPSKDFLIAYLKVDGKVDVKSYDIKTESLSNYDYREASQLEEAFQIISQQADQAYDEFQATDITGHEFKVDMYEFMSSMKSDSIQNAMMRAYPKLTDGTDPADVANELKHKLSEIEDIFNTERIKDIDYGQTGGDMKMDFVCKTGIPAIDNDIGGIYTRLIYTLTSQPKGGKTRFALVHYVYKVLTEAKKDVVFYELELSDMQVKNILIAHHIIRVYGGRVKIPDSVMNKGEMTEEQRQIYESAKIDLFESGRYGKLIIYNDCTIETFKDELHNTLIDNPGVKLVGIDYMGMIQSEPDNKYERRREQYQIITDAFAAVRKIINATNIAAICINQFNDDGISAAYSGKPIRSGHTQGGHAITRYTDYDMYLTFTEEQWLAKIRMLTLAAGRGSEGFGTVPLSTDLSCSIFNQELPT